MLFIVDYMIKGQKYTNFIKYVRVMLELWFSIMLSKMGSKTFIQNFKFIAISVCLFFIFFDFYVNFIRNFCDGQLWALTLRSFLKIGYRTHISVCSVFQEESPITFSQLLVLPITFNLILSISLIIKKLKLIKQKIQNFIKDVRIELRG